MDGVGEGEGWKSGRVKEGMGGRLEGWKDGGLYGLGGRSTIKDECATGMGLGNR